MIRNHPNMTLYDPVSNTKILTILEKIIYSLIHQHLQRHHVYV